jgi:hypothetical protein
MVYIKTSAQEVHSGESSIYASSHFYTKVNNIISYVLLNLQAV